MDNNEPRYLTPAEVADLLRLSRSFVYHAVESGELPAVKFGRAVRIRSDVLDDWIAAHATAGNNSRSA